MKPTSNLEEYIATRLADKREPFIWRSFIQLLSVERTKMFISELALPVQPGEYSKIMHFARACLEVYMSPLRWTRTGPFDAPEFPKYWSLYRGKEAVLNEEMLHQYAKRYTDAKGVEFDMYVELEEWIGLDKANELKAWFSKHFHPAYEEVDVWLHAFWRLLKDRSEKGNQSVGAPISNEQWQLVQEFCDDYQDAKQSLGERFREITLAAISGEPTLWEAVLQTFPVDSVAGFEYPWLSSIEKCLRLQLFRDTWRRLIIRIGPDIMKEFTNWVRSWWVRIDEFQSDLPDETIWLL